MIGGMDAVHCVWVSFLDCVSRGSPMETRVALLDRNIENISGKGTKGFNRVDVSAILKLVVL